MTSTDLLAAPWEWQIDSAGRSVAMMDLGLDRWEPVRPERPSARDGRRVIVVARAPAQMPRLAARSAHHGFGAPRITARRPSLAQQTAWLVDLAGWSLAVVADAYAPRCDLRARIAVLDEEIRTGPQRTLQATQRADERRSLYEQLRAARRRDYAASKRDLAAMRRSHWERGAIPWALWPNGELPAEWWLTDRCALWTAVAPTLAVARRAVLSRPGRHLTALRAHTLGPG